MIFFPGTCRRVTVHCLASRVLLLGLSLNITAPRLASQGADEPKHRPALPMVQTPGQQPILPPDFPNEKSLPPLTPKQQRQLLKASYERMKQEADELADLAKSLQDEMKKSNQEILSLQILEKADRIEKLAKKIKNEAVR